MSELLNVHDLVVEYPGRPRVRAVNGVSVTVSAGEVVALVGESGCGKSTVARTIVGMTPVTAGQVLYRGNEVPALGLRRRKPEFTGIQMVFQDPNSSLNPRKRVGAQITDGIKTALARGDEGSTPDEWLSKVGLAADAGRRFAHEFSGGQRQRIAIARALASRPSLLVADEPISALDASTQAAVAGLMKALAIEARAGMLFISHDLSVVRLIADRLVVMYRGQIMESGPTDLVWNDPIHPYTRALMSAIPLPDGKGTMPAAPATDAPADWAIQIPQAVNREEGRA